MEALALGEDVSTDISRDEECDRLKAALETIAQERDGLESRVSELEDMMVRLKAEEGGGQELSTEGEFQLPQSDLRQVNEVLKLETEALNASCEALKASNGSLKASNESLKASNGDLESALRAARDKQEETKHSIKALAAEVGA